MLSAAGKFSLQVPLFCRHNRFVAECPICSKGTVLDPARKPERRPRARAAPTRLAASAARGPFASAGPYANGSEVRLEKVPGGVRLAVWQGGQIVKNAPVLALSDLPGMVAEAMEKGVADLPQPDASAVPAVGTYRASPGRAGELRDELRLERLDEERVRIARWVMRPNRGWELQEAPVLLPAERLAEALCRSAS